MILLLWMKPSNSGTPSPGTIAAKANPVRTFANATTVRTLNA